MHTEISSNLIPMLQRLESPAEHDTLPTPPKELLTLLLAFQQLTGTIQALLAESARDSLSSVSASDRFKFGFCWTFIRDLQTEGFLYSTISARKKEIEALREKWRPYVQLCKQQDPAFYDKIELILETGKLLAAEEGSGAAYFLVDAGEKIHFVVKPIDEDIFCLHNRKHYASPFNQADFRVREHIPLYRSAQTDALCFQVAKLCDIESITPKTAVIIIESDHFFDLSDRLLQEDLPSYIQETGAIVKQKFCSIQEYVQNSKDLYEVVDEMISCGLSDPQIETCFDSEDYEDANLLIWLSYDNDGHASNFRVYPKKKDPVAEKIIYGIKKVDNGLSFPERNTDFINFLSFLPNSKNPLSERIKEKIRNIPTTKIIQEMHVLEMDAAEEAFLQRVRLLQKLAQREQISLYEINLRFMLLGTREGESLALSTLSLEELEELVEGTPPSYELLGS